MKEFRAHVDDYVEGIMRTEGRDDADCERCPTCPAEAPQTPKFRCSGCFGRQLYCRDCCVRQHATRPFCRIEVRFEGESWAKDASSEVIENETERLYKQGLSSLILQMLSYSQNASMSLTEIHQAVKQNQGPYFPHIYQQQKTLTSVHISQIYTTVARLQQVGLIASTVNQPGDTFENRRYWRAPTHD